jgi:chromosome segregation ATPase
MDIPEAIEEMDGSIESLEELLNTAYSEADQASDEAGQARCHADSAEDQASYARSSVEDAQSTLDTLKTEFQELKDRLEEMEAADDDDVGGVSDLQKDINKWKTKVMHYHNRGVSVENIAAHLEIGEFLVNRILEAERTKNAA